MTTAYGVEGMEYSRIKIEQEDTEDSRLDCSVFSNFGCWGSRIKQEDDIEIYLDINKSKEETVVKDKNIQNDAFGRRFSCVNCNFSTVNRKVFKSHFFLKHTVTDKAPSNFSYSGSRGCPLCFRTFNKFKLLIKHFRESHKNIRLPKACPHCKYVSCSSDTLKGHIMGVHQGKPYACGHCELRCFSFSNLKYHIIGKHTAEKPLFCRYDKCSFTTAWPTCLTTHVAAKHSDDFRYKCTFCDYKASQNGTMKRHVMAKHTKNKRYRCSQCNFKCCHPTTLKYHVEGKHTRLLKYECSDCDFKSSWVTSLNSHRSAIHTLKRPHSCPDCPYSSVQSAVLKRHILSKHSNEKPFHCDQCEYSANRKKLLETHIAKMHCGTNLFSCHKCGLKFSTRGDLRFHALHNHRVTPLKCRFCEFSSLQREVLRNHCANSHGNKKLRLCPQCDYFTYNPGDLTRHNARFHASLSEAQHKCSSCNHISSRKEHLDSHIRAKHTKKTIRLQHRFKPDPK